MSGGSDTGSAEPGESSQRGRFRSGVLPLVVSGRDDAGLRRQAAGVSAFLDGNPGLSRPTSDFRSPDGRRSPIVPL